MNLHRGIRALAAIGMILALSGCVVVPAYYPHHAYRPYRYYY